MHEFFKFPTKRSACVNLRCVYVARSIQNAVATLTANGLAQLASAQVVHVPLVQMVWPRFTLRIKLKSLTGCCSELREEIFMASGHFDYEPQPGKFLELIVIVHFVNKISCGDEIGA